jgi:hypothetical protein
MASSPGEWQLFRVSMPKAAITLSANLGRSQCLMLCPKLGVRSGGGLRLRKSPAYLMALRRQ